MQRYALLLYLFVLILYTIADENQLFTVLTLLALCLTFVAKIIVRLFDTLTAVASFKQSVYLFLLCAGCQLVMQGVALTGEGVDSRLDLFQLCSFLPLAACIFSFFKHLLYANSPYMPPLSVVETVKPSTVKEKPRMYEILNEIVTYPMSNYA